MKTLKSSLRGFTLIELLVVIAIIALLTGIIMTSLTGSRAKARDAQRVSDLNQIQLSIEQYFDRCGQYPDTITGTLTSINNGCPSGISLGSFISKIPVDPSGSSYTYATNLGYQGQSYPTDYILQAAFEGTNSALQNSLTSVPADIVNPSVPSCTVSPSNDYCIGPK